MRGQNQMRIFVNSDEGGKPFELFTHEDNGLDEPGWYYMLMIPTELAGAFEPLEDAPTGPFESLTAAFNDAINCNYGDQPSFPAPKLEPYKDAEQIRAEQRAYTKSIMG